MSIQKLTHLSSRKLGAAVGFLGLLGGAYCWLVRLPVTPASALSYILFDVLMTLCTPLSAFLLGRQLATQLHRRRWVLAVVHATLIAGALNGLVIGSVVGGASCFDAAPATQLPMAVVIWLAGSLTCGLCGGLLFLPGILAIARSARRTLGARPGSLLAAADARSLLRSTLFGATACGVLATVVTPLTSMEPFGRPVCLLLAVATLLALSLITAIDVRLWWRIRSIRRALPRMTHRGAGVPSSAPAPAALFDLGVGEDRWESLGPAPESPYRGSAPILSAVQGDPELAHRSIRTALLVDLGAACLAAALGAMNVFLMVGQAIHDQL